MDDDAVARRLTGLWTAVLGAEPGPDDDFFELGGTSLSALKMIADVQSAFGLELDVEAFFEEPTLARLTAAVRAAAAAVPASAPAP